MSSNVNCEWSSDIQAATLYINQAPRSEDYQPPPKCSEAWCRVAADILNLKEVDDWLLKLLFTDPCYHIYLQSALVNVLYTKYGSGISQESKVLKVPIEDETFQNMGHCMFRTLDSERGLDILFNLNR